MANLNIRIDETLKKDVENILSNLGLTSSDAVRIFYAQIKNCRGIPFDLRLHVPSSQTCAAEDELMHDMECGKLSKPYSNSEELIADLLK